ncbi:MAG: DEAD/DEAH box helicase [Actinomycetaceae bacterium]|nr:DEAD/DEAH box helicase [Arcanobacterium sp.]MDD7505639.1 DEAD/DEAH box helicase [Actinomycetaceae bacterium]MDY6143423.1 DEAD/DEAH box helicase [Arcanobacterium sp.]
MSSLFDVISHHAPGQITGHYVVPAREEELGQWPQWVPDSLLNALTPLGASRPWIHQAEAADLLYSGNHTVLATGTGSGKSLAAWVPALAAIENHSEHNSGSSFATIRRKPTTLYLSPTKALAADQEHHLVELAHRTNARIGVATVDGDADRATRLWARDYADIVLTNPDFLHFAMLSRHEAWGRFLRGLRFIVIDEFHSYRGRFGANVALIMRRLLRLARHYGADPHVLFLSATSAEPDAVALRFIGDAFGAVRSVTRDGSPRGERTVAAMQCKEFPRVQGGDGDDRTDEDLVLNAVTHNMDFMRRSANTEAGDVTATLVAEGAQVLTFVRSRPGTERVAEVAQNTLHRRAPHLEDRVAAYRGGYLPEERRELERRLRSGELQALATTSALELGIDIPNLDAVIVTGWPGTHASFQQQIGRAGRAGGEGLGIFIARDNPLDQFMVEHPEQLTDSSAEVSVFDPHNPWILPNHLCSAAAELPLTPEDAEVFGLPDTQYFAELEAQQLLKRRPNGWFWNTSLHISAHSLVDVRGEAQNVNIIDSEDGSLLGTIDSSQVDLTAYPGAIYIHQGVPFEVEQREGDVALVHHHRDEEIRTYPTEENFVDIVHTEESREMRGVTWNYGTVSVRNRVVSYDVHRARDGLYLGTVPLQMPQRQFETTGVWFTMDALAARRLGLDAAILPGALHAAEHTMIALLPLFATCDRWDLGGMSTAIHPDTGNPTVIIHDAEAGGSGCAERGFYAAFDWVEATLNRLRNCECEAGCPKCVQSPKCGNNNSPLSKGGAITLLELLASVL